MDEAEKYQQRLQAIAEKRRMQEEQERAKRDVEDERLRLQQLKRKSLRDQWLMEGPLSSPTSPSSQDSGPHSPLWGPHSPGTEKRIDELQEESRRLAEGEQPKEQTEDGRKESVRAAVAPEDVFQNGQEKTTSSDSTEDAAANSISSLRDETAAVLTNGSTGREADTNHFAFEIINTSVETSPEPVLVSDGTIATALLGYVHAEQGLTPAVVDDHEEEEEEEEGVLVMRAERIIILTDEDVPPQGQEEVEVQREEKEQREEEQESAVPLDTAQGEGGAEDRTRVEPEATPLETSPSLDALTVSDSTADVQTAGEEVSVKVVEEEEEEGAADSGSIAPDSDPSLQSAADAPGDPAAASVPIYPQGPPSPRLGPEGETRPGVGDPAAAAAAEGTAGDAVSELPSPARTPAPLASTFQDVPLVEPRGSGARAAEQEPLLGQAKAPQSKAAGGLGSAEARRAPPGGASANAAAPAGSRAAGEGVSPKHKSCQCCSVM